MIYNVKWELQWIAHRVVSKPPIMTKNFNLCTILNVKFLISLDSDCHPRNFKLIQVELIIKFLFPGVRQNPLKFYSVLMGLNWLNRFHFTFFIFSIETQ